MRTIKCYIPICGNTTANKVLISVPRDFSIRKIWWELAGILKPLAPKSHLYCCEDHFDVGHFDERTEGFPLILKIGYISKLWGELCVSKKASSHIKTLTNPKLNKKRP
nr:unnamed protein product [Callosobruchus analis]